MDIGKILNKINGLRTFRAPHIFVWVNLLYLFELIIIFMTITYDILLPIFFIVGGIMEIFLTGLAIIPIFITELFIKKPLKNEILIQNRWYGIAFWIGFLIFFVGYLISVCFIIAIMISHSKAG